MAGDPVILSEEPNNVRIQIDDPTKKKAQVSVTKVARKPGLLDKCISGFFGENVTRENLGEYLLNDIAIPAGKRVLNNGIQSGLKRAGDATQVLLWGKVINSSNGPTDYTSFSNPNVANQPIAYKLADNVETFAFRNKDDAAKCLAYLRGRIQAYGSTSVLDYYEYLGQPLDYNMADRGWNDLSMATISASQQGIIIEFPRPIVLKKG